MLSRSYNLHYGVKRVKIRISSKFYQTLLKCRVRMLPTVMLLGNKCHTQGKCYLLMISLNHRMFGLIVFRVVEACSHRGSVMKLNFIYNQNRLCCRASTDFRMFVFCA